VRLTKILLFLCVVAIGTGGWLFWVLTNHGFSARGKPGWIEAYVARHTRSLLTPRDAKRLKNPLPATPLHVAEGRDHFADHCAICHANDGSGKTQINSGLYPPAPDMRGPGTQALSDGEIFYIIRDGIRFSGMPGWGGEDEENWKLVLFVRRLPHLTAKELELMKDVNHLE
jgi:mono/diheme cytochrome c family protein